jgi:hypothetical protein
MISVIIPSIRTHHWERVITTLSQSCPNVNHEIIFIGPFTNHSILRKYNNVKHIKSYSSVPVCLQIGTLEAKYEYVVNTTDDGLFLPDSLSRCFEYFLLHNNNKHDAINLLYTEGVGFRDSPRSFDVRDCPEFRLKGINQDYSLFVQPLFLRSTFIELGGYDCGFEYSNHSHIDYALRLQKAGGKIMHSTEKWAMFDHMPNRTGDHKPVHDAQTQIDEPRFNKMWEDDRPICIDYDNYKDFDTPWERRFSKQYSSYEEMKKHEGYN